MNGRRREFNNSLRSDQHREEAEKLFKWTSRGEILSIVPSAIEIVFFLSAKKERLLCARRKTHNGLGFLEREKLTGPWMMYEMSRGFIAFRTLKLDFEDEEVVDSSLTNEVNLEV